MVRFTALSWSLLIAASLAGCARPPMPAAAAGSAPAAAWGPFARDCAHTRVIRPLFVRHGTQTNAETNYEVCTGFSVLSAADATVGITASTNATSDAGDTPVISRLVRTPDGVARPARAGDSGLLAQGSDNPVIAAMVAQEISAPRRRTGSGETLSMPVTLPFALPVQGELSCHPTGAGVSAGRPVRTLSCATDQAIHDARLDVQLHLTGTAEVDSATGVRVAAQLEGRLTGRAQFAGTDEWQQIDYALLYRSSMDLEDAP
jgi:hypothetical protein